MKWLRWFALCATVAGAGMCVRDRLQPADSRGATDDDPTTARALGFVQPQQAELPRDEALAALEADARRREARFTNAVQPGFLFDATRVSQRDIDDGRYTPAELYQLGGQLFGLRFERRNGFGAKDLPLLGRVHLGARGGPDAYSCSDCHRRGGPAGAGDAADNAYLDGDGDRPDSALERNPPPLHGAGLVELLAREMSADLAAQRRTLVREARSSGKPARAELLSKGVRFGFLEAKPDGNVDTRGVRGVDRDLVVKPFGWKGHATSVREVVEDQLLIHHGMQSSHLARHGDAARVGAFARPDPDGDGVVDEISEGQLSALTAFVAMQEVPQVGMPRGPDQLAIWSEGQRRFEQLGCADCHRPYLTLESTVYELPSRDGAKPLRIDLATHGADPRLARAHDGSYRVYLYSDLRRHPVGANLTEARRYRGVSQAEVLTRPLWGIARSRPYLHDARAPTLGTAILQHSGAATRARKAFAALREAERAPLRVFLTSLTRGRRFVTR
jgi:hypothetical protein